MGNSEEKMEQKSFHGNNAGSIFLIVMGGITIIEGLLGLMGRIGLLTRLLFTPVFLLPGAVLLFTGIRTLPSGCKKRLKTHYSSIGYVEFFLYAGLGAYILYLSIMGAGISIIGCFLGFACIFCGIRFLPSICTLYDQTKLQKREKGEYFGLIAFGAMGVATLIFAQKLDSDGILLYLVGFASIVLGICFSPLGQVYFNEKYRIEEEKRKAEEEAVRAMQNTVKASLLLYSKNWTKICYSRNNTVCLAMDNERKIWLHCGGYSCHHYQYRDLVTFEGFATAETNTTATTYVTGGTAYTEVNNDTQVYGYRVEYVITNGEHYSIPCEDEYTQKTMLAMLAAIRSQAY